MESPKPGAILAGPAADMVESFPNNSGGWSARVDKNGQTDNYSVVVLCAN
jgi:hypothetical protein